jgi:hypothetical protein
MDPTEYFSFFFYRMTENSQATERCFITNNRKRLSGYVWSSCNDVLQGWNMHVKNRMMGKAQTLDVPLLAGPMPSSNNFELSSSDHVHIENEWRHLLCNREEW